MGEQLEEQVGAGIQLNWPTTQTVGQVKLYDRSFTFMSNITAGTLTFSNGSSVSISPFTGRRDGRDGDLRGARSDLGQVHRHCRHRRQLGCRRPRRVRGLRRGG